MGKRLVSLLVVLAAAITLVTAQTRPAEVLLEAARKTDVVDGDLPGAIKQYQAIVNRFQKTDRAAAATALLRTAELYRRIGDAQSRRIYERVVEEFGNLAEATLARTRLATLGSPGAAARPGPICTNCVGPFAHGFTISPDGRWLGYSDVNGHLMGRSLTSGEVREVVTFPSPSESDPPTRFRGRRIIWSPDSTQIAYFFRDLNAPGPVRDRGQLRVIANVPRSEPRTLVDNPDFIYVNPYAWWPDGKSILVATQRRDFTWQLARVSTATGTMTTIQSLNWQYNEFFNGPDLSPDGKYIVYATLTVNRSGQDPFGDSRVVGGRYLHVLAADGSREEILPVSASGFTSPVWTADGSRILFTSDRDGSGNYDLWAIDIRSGKAAGAPVLVKASIGAVALIGNMRSDVLHYVQPESASRRIVVADLHPKASGVPKSAATSFAGREATWSPDGASLAWFQGDIRSPVSPIVVHSFESDRQRVYPLERGNRPAPHWVSDGSALLTTTVAFNPTRVAVDRVDLKTSAVSRLGDYAPDSDDWVPFVVSLAPDGGTMYVGGNRNGSDQFQMVAIDLATRNASAVLPGIAGVRRAPEVFRYTIGEAFEIVQQPRMSLGIATSPDGKTAAVTVMRDGHTYLATMNLDGSQYRELYGPVPGRSLPDRIAGRRVTDREVSRLSDLRWLRNGAGIAFGIQQDDLSWKLMRVSLDGRAEPLRVSASNELTLESGTLRFEVSPDGTRIASERMLTFNGELWALDLASLKQRKK